MKIRQTALEHLLVSLLLIAGIGILITLGYCLELHNVSTFITHALYGIAIMGILLGLIGMYGACDTNAGHFFLLSLLLNVGLCVWELTNLAPLFTPTGNGLAEGIVALSTFASITVLCFTVNKLLLDHLIQSIFQPEVRRGYIKSIG